MREADAVAAVLVGEVLVEPGAELVPERLGLGRVVEVHAVVIVDATAGERLLPSRLPCDVLGVQLVGRLDRAVDLELAHDVDLAERLAACSPGPRRSG